jgi:glutaredoxin
LIILIGFLVLGHWQTPNEVNAEATKTLKACHICDPILPDSTATPTPDGCAVDCLDSNPPAAQQDEENKMATQQNNQAEIFIVFYWMDGCPHCEEVMETTLPVLKQKYGDLLDIQQVELISVEDVNQLYDLGEQFGLEREKIEVPFVVFNESALSGQDQINKTLPDSIQREVEINHPNINLPKDETVPNMSFTILLFFAVVFMIGLVVGVFFKKGFPFKTK